MDIVSMFKRRDDVFYRETKRILNDLAPIVDGATLFMDDIYGIDVNRTLVWEGVNLIEGFVTLVGVISYMPGSTLMLDDQMVTITEQNKAQYQQLVHVGIPIKLAMTKNSHNINAYLHSLDESNQNHKHDDVPILNDFDLSALTEQQRLCLVPSTQDVH